MMCENFEADGEQGVLRLLNHAMGDVKAKRGSERPIVETRRRAFVAALAGEWGRQRLCAAATEKGAEATVQKNSAEEPARGPRIQTPPARKPVAHKPAAPRSSPTHNQAHAHVAGTPPVAKTDGPPAPRGVVCAISGAAKGEAACRVDPTLLASHAATEEILSAWREVGRPAYEAFRRAIRWEVGSGCAERSCGANGTRASGHQPGTGCAVSAASSSGGGSVTHKGGGGDGGGPLGYPSYPLVLPMASLPHSGSSWTRAVWSVATGIAAESIYHEKQSQPRGCKTELGVPGGFVIVCTNSSYSRRTVGGVAAAAAATAAAGGEQGRCMGCTTASRLARSGVPFPPALVKRHFEFDRPTTRHLCGSRPATVPAASASFPSASAWAAAPASSSANGRRLRRRRLATKVTHGRGWSLPSAHGLVRMVRDPLEQVLKDCHAFETGANASHAPTAARVAGCVRAGEMTRRFVRFHCDVAASGRVHLAPPRCVPGLTLDYGALVLQPHRAFLRLFDFLCLVTPDVTPSPAAAAAATPQGAGSLPTTAATAVARTPPSPWYDRWAPTREASLAAALRAYPPGLKSGRPRPSDNSTGHFEDGLPADFDAQADRPWELPDAATLGWLNATQLRGFFADLSHAVASCR